jgi:hypothetical protein
MSKGKELQGIQTLELDGRTYKLRFDLNALCALEERFGGLQEALDAKLGMSTVRAFLWVALQSEHGDEFETERDAGRLVDMSNFRDVMEVVMKALMSAMPPDDDEDKGKSKAKK